MTSTSESVMTTRTIDHVQSIDIHVPVQQVWDEITKTGRVQRPLFNCVLETELRPGSRLRYYSPNRQRVFVVGEVLEVDPPRRLKHTYHFVQNGHEPATFVTWELTEIPGGCRVTLTHAGFTDAHKAPEKQAAGWVQILNLLKSELETGTIPFGTRMLYAVMGMTMWMLPKSTKVSEVEKVQW